MILLLIFPIVWIAAAAGGQALRLMFRKSDSAPLPLEHFVYSALIGLGALAYGNLALGLAGQFGIEAVAVWIAVLAAIGAGEHARMAKNLAAAVKSLKLSAFGLSIGAVFAAFFLASLFGVLTPPYPLEYDSLSYHLADPKIYVLHHRIIALPWESHSNFAFTMEMLYSIGVMLHSFALAKSFHLLMAIFSAIGIFCVCRRFAAPKAGVYGALIFVSMPLVWWLAGTAYVDLAASAYGIWSFHALVCVIEKRSRGWLALLGAILGLLISIKALGAATALLSLLVLFYYEAREERRAGGRTKFLPAVKTVFLAGVLTAIIGCPWYVKSWANTGNPVYPFAYGVFGGRGWDEANARQYSRDQASFGVGHLSAAGTADKLGDFLFSPWNLTQFTMPGHMPPDHSKANPFNDVPLFVVSLGPLFLALLFALAFLKTSSPLAVRLSVVFSVVSLFGWVFATEQERYLTSVYPLLCVAAGYVLQRLLEEKRISGYAGGALLAVSVLQSLFFARIAIAQWMPVVSGAQSSQDFLLQNFDAYAAFLMINEKPDNGGVVLYGEPRALYCDKPYMWGEPTHGKAIPYDSLPNAEALRQYLLSKGYRYILVNRVGAPFQPAPPGQAPKTWAEKVCALLQTLPGEPCDSHGVLVLYTL